MIAQRGEETDDAAWHALGRCSETVMLSERGVWYGIESTPEADNDALVRHPGELHAGYPECLEVPRSDDAGTSDALQYLGFGGCAHTLVV